MSTWTRVGVASMPSVLAEPWRRHAQCAGRDPRLWDPPEAQTTHADVQRWQRAAAVCATCPVLDECAAAVTRADAGTVRAAGLVGDDGSIGPIRRAIGRPLAACGTDTARRRHHAAGERCVACARTGR